MSRVPPLVCMFLNAKRQAAERVRWRADVARAVSASCGTKERLRRTAEQVQLQSIGAQSLMSRTANTGGPRDSTRAALPRTARLNNGLRIARGVAPVDAISMLLTRKCK